MALTFGFYNSLNEDRPYDSLQMSRIFDGVILDGVYENVGERLMVSEADTPGMFVVVGTGRAWFDHTWTHLDAKLYLAVPPAHAALSRIDIVYLEVNSAVGVRANKIAIASGEFSLTPVAPTLVNTSTQHQYPLCSYLVGPAVTVITNSDITNMVGTTPCPFVICPLEHITTSELLAQWSAQWTVWFNFMKGQLTQDAATNLQNQILNMQEAGFKRQIFIPAKQFTRLDTGCDLMYTTYEGMKLMLFKGGTTEAVCEFGFPTDLDNTAKVRLYLVYATTGTDPWYGSIYLSENARGRTRPYSEFDHSFTQIFSGSNTIATAGFGTGVGIELLHLPSDYAEGMLGHIKIARHGAHVNDVNNGSVEVYGVILDYVSKPVWIL